MANKRNMKSILGQTSKPVEEKVEKTEKLVVEEPVVEIPAEEEVVEVPVEEEVVEVPEAPEQPIEETEEIEEIVKEEAPKLRKVSDLNGAEYKYYMNTGIIPQ